MSAQGPFSSAHPFSSEFLKSWVDQAGAFQEMFARLVDPSTAALPRSMASPLLAPWKNFVDALGMGGFNPEQMFPGTPALGLSREYQETAARLLDLSKQFQQRYAEFAQQNAAIMQDAFHVLKKRFAEFAQQNATIMQDAFHVLKKRFDEASLADKTPAALYDAWIHCAEGTYAQAAHSERFARLLAELCNISSAFKVERGKLTEQIARHLDLPSRAEVDTLHRQVRALTTAIRAAAASSAASGAATSGSAASGAAKASKPPRKPRKRAKK